MKKYLPPKSLAQRTAEVRSRWRCGPLPADNPFLQATCAACKELFRTGDYTALIPLGPGLNLEARRKCREGDDYTAVAIHVHWACATGEEDENRADSRLSA